MKLPTIAAVAAACCLFIPVTAQSHTTRCGYTYRNPQAYILWYDVKDHAAHMKTSRNINDLLAACEQDGVRYIVTGIASFPMIQGYAADFQKRRITEKAACRKRDPRC